MRTFLINKTKSQSFKEMPPRASEARRFLRVFLSRKVVIFGLVVIISLIVVAVFAPSIAPYDPYAQSLENALLQPSLEHPLGTDAIGRDMLSRIIFGTRTSLSIASVALSIAASIGMTMGLVAGYFGGIIQAVIMRFIDALMTIPMILLALVIAAVLGSGIGNVMIALGVGMIPPYARLMCSQVLTIKEADYITAVRSIGANNIRIMLRHIIPNCFPTLIVLVTMMVGYTILAEAMLSFLGIGIKPPGAAWGAMINDGYEYLMMHPILSIGPGFAIILVVFSFNMVGDGLRDALDPRLRGSF